MLAERGAQRAHFKFRARLAVLDDAPFADQAVLDLALRDILGEPVVEALVANDELNHVGHRLVRGEEKPPVHALAAHELGAVVACLRRLLVQEFVQRRILRLLLNSWMLDGVVCDDKQGIQVVGYYFGLIIVVSLLQEEVVLEDVNREEEVLVLLAQQVGLPDHVICTHALRVL